MTLLAFALLVLSMYLVVEVGCRDEKPPAGVPWSIVVQYLRVSKKARTRGDVVGGLSRRERRVRHVR